MTESHEKDLPEENESLWTLVASPTIWAAHFLLCYITAAIWCAKVVPRIGSLLEVRVAIGAYTAIALAGIGYSGVRAFRRHKTGTATVPHDFDTPEDRHRFLGFATLLLAGLSAVAVFYSALVAVFFRNCH